jgi:hypothetical protein
MKKLVTVTEVEGEGLVSLLGKKVLLLCGSYFYSGILVGVNTNDVLLEDAAIVYETGPWTAGDNFKDEQNLGGRDLYVRTAAIEAYMEV